MPHAEVHTVILPHAIAYNEPYAKSQIGKLSSLFKADRVSQGIWDLQKKLGAPTTLKELGFKEEDLEKAADLASQKPYPNPAPLDKEKLLLLLRDAFAGNAPSQY